MQMPPTMHNRCVPAKFQSESWSWSWSWNWSKKRKKRKEKKKKSEKKGRQTQNLPQKNKGAVQKPAEMSSSLGYLGKKKKANCKKHKTDDRRNGPPSSVNDNPSKCRPAGSGGYTRTHIYIYIDRCACVTKWTDA